jgi:hypothetical protein
VAQRKQNTTKELTMSCFLFETHAHTSEVSRCAQIPAAKVIADYESAGYDGIVITDHMNEGSIGRLKNRPWDEKVDFFINGYNKALEAAERSGKGMTVLLGAEVCFDKDPNDYLVFGISEDFLRRCGDLTSLGLKNFRKIADENNLLIFQAHPFRVSMAVTDYRILDGIEVYNGNSSHNSNNDAAMFWADKYSLLKSSGSDFHGMWGMKPGGIYFESPVRTNSDFISALKENNYLLK